MGFVYRLVFLLFSFFSCTKNNSIPDEVILAKVGSSIITVQDFIRRSEYTIRPNYCRQDNYIHKKIILNSLISEKLIALEYSKKKDNPTNENMKLFLKGRKEQAMRQLYFSEEFHSKVNLTQKELKNAYNLSGRTVKVQFLNLPNLEIASKIEQLHSSGIPLDSIHNVLWSGNAPIREIDWFSREPDEIHDALFSKNIFKGKLLGPFESVDGTFVLMNVVSWHDEIKITESDRKILWSDVKERLTDKKAKNEYLQTVEDLMSGKKMNLNPDIFYKYAEKAADYFFKVDASKKKMLNKALWNDDKVDDNMFSFDVEDNDINPSSVILEYEGEPWTVEELNYQLKSHPFVFRKRKMNRSEFSDQLRLAIADLIRDIEITKECYKMGFDKNWRVKLNHEMWSDVSKSKKYLSTLRAKNKNITDQNEWLVFMNPIIDSLQSAHSDKIKINMDIFERIKLTKTDMMVNQRGVPYPILVPGFPILTTDDRLDYGSKIE